MNQEIIEIVKKNIYEDIVELSDLDLQKKLWLNENNDTGLISSYTEVMCRLFDDNCLDDFIDKEAHILGLTITQISELDKLRKNLNNYKEKETDGEIIEDPLWNEVVIQAQKVLNIWELI